MNNLAHPCLRDICVNFFYAGKNTLARMFPDDFRNEIPDNAIALVATAVSFSFTHFLDEALSSMFSQWILHRLQV